MAEERFKVLGAGSFFGHHLYERTVPTRHFLCQLEELLRHVIMMAMAKRLEFGSIQIVDSTHTLANVNTAKERRRTKAGQPRRDSGARWGVKEEQRKEGEGAGDGTTEPLYLPLGPPSPSTASAHRWRGRV